EEASPQTDERRERPRTPTISDQASGKGLRLNMSSKAFAERPARSGDRADDLERQIEALSSRPRPELVEEWTRIYGRRPPKYIKRGLIERAISWHMQAKVYGGLKPEIRNYLLKVAEADAAKVKQQISVPAQFRPGMRLL